MQSELKNYISGKWTASSNGKTLVHRNPANLEEITGIWPASTREDASKAIEAAQKAFPMWSGLTVYKRAEYIKKAISAIVREREKIAGVITLENGKTYPESLAEVDSAIREMDYQVNEGLRMFGQIAPSATEGVFAYSKRFPLGVVSIISPWNFPFNVPGRKVTPALIAGNTCVLKPSSLTPQTGLKFVEAFIEAGLPEGVLNFVTGAGSTVGEELITNPAIKAISFTGSTGVGRGIHEKAAKILAKTQLEMGGKNPAVVLADADLVQAAKAVVTATFACAGQWCTSTSRLIVVKEAAEKMKELILAEVQKYVVGNGMNPASTMGTVCGTEQVKNILNYIEIGKREGATLAFGGERLQGSEYENGCFIQPTVFTNVTPDMTIAREEIFGPVLSVIEVENFDEAVKIANDVPFGLASSIFTTNLNKAMTFMEKADVGLAHVNIMTAHKEPQLSFGGVKESGFGLPEAGSTGIEFFTRHKTVYIKY